MEMKVKICGLTNVADVRAAMAAGADMLGFIFFPRSPRYVTPERVLEILASTKPGQSGILTVGVFVNESARTIAQVLDCCKLDAAQLHGEEPPAMLGLEDSSAEALPLRPLASGLHPRDREPRGVDKLHAGVEQGQSLMYRRAYKALRPRSHQEAMALARRYALPLDLQAKGHLPAFLLDAYHPDLRGGTGTTGDWQTASSLSSRYPLLLAGGLSPENVAGAVQAVRPWGVDVASGIEEAPGRKDRAALCAFVAAAKQLQASQR
jgi:phosphoribosylanthranilate isomerase